MTISAYAVWQVRTGGSNTNGGGYDSTISGAGTDYSQQNAAQWTTTSVTSSGTTCTDNNSHGTLTSAMIGNAVWLSGNAYFVLTVPTANTFTVDRAPGVTAVAAHLGGAWADPFVNPSNNSGIVQPGNTVSINGSGSQNPTSDDYTTASSLFLPAIGNMGGNGQVKFIGKNGRPRLGFPGAGWGYAEGNLFQNLYFAANGTANASVGVLSTVVTQGATTVANCTFDQNGYDVTLFSGSGAMISQCEFTTTHAARGTTANPAVYLVHFGALIFASNVHDTLGAGIQIEAGLGTRIVGNIIAKCGGDGIVTTSYGDLSEGNGCAIIGNTIDANAGNGITFYGEAQLMAFLVMNNLITNHTGGGKYGISANFGSTAANDRNKCYLNWNFFYGNTTDLLSLSLNSASMQNNATGTNPGYAAQSTEGYNLGTALKAAGYPGAAFPQSLSKTATRSYVSPGAVQRFTGAVASAALPSGVLFDHFFIPRA